jgi:murein DD-endopeptidase MepM/ murein hydrolase activator NlpD
VGLGGLVLLSGLVVGLATGTGSKVHGSAASLEQANLTIASATPPPGATAAPKFHLSDATAPLPPAASLGADASSAATAGAGASITVTRSYPLIWPITGPITSYMGYSHPLGIDIGLDYDSVAPILAAADGTVSFAGGDPCCSYGNYVVVDHGDGLSTLYAHLDEIKVNEGAQVRQGDLLGYGGNTGHSTGKHLHFEVRTSYGRLDPLEVLPENAAPEAPASLDCASSSLVVDAGSRVTLNLSGILDGGSLTGATLSGADGSSDSAPSVTSQGSLVVLDTPARVAASQQDDTAYDLTADVAQNGEQTQVVCHVLLRTLVAASHYYPPLPDSEYELPTSTPTLIPTPSRTPIRAATPTPPPPTRTPRPAATSKPSQPTATPPPGAKRTATPIHR